MKSCWHPNGAQSPDHKSVGTLQYRPDVSAIIADDSTFLHWARLAVIVTAVVAGNGASLVEDHTLATGYAGMTG